MAESGKLFDVQTIANTRDVRIVRAVYRAFGPAIINGGLESDFNFEYTLATQDPFDLMSTADGAANAEGFTPNHYEVEYASIHGVIYGPAEVTAMFEPVTLASGNDWTIAASGGTITAASGTPFSDVQAGDAVRLLTDSGNNDGYYRVKTATNTVVTVADNDTLTDEASGFTGAVVAPVRPILSAHVTTPTPGAGTAGTSIKYEMDFRDLGRFGGRFALADPLPASGRNSATTNNKIILFTQGLGRQATGVDTRDSFDITIAARPVY